MGDAWSVLMTDSAGAATTMAVTPEAMEMLEVESVLQAHGIPVAWDPFRPGEGFTSFYVNASTPRPLHLMVPTSSLPDAQAIADDMRSGLPEPEIPLEDSPRVAFVGEGELPPDFDRPNWGAALFVYIWLWLYGFRRWAIGVTLFYVALLVVENALLVFLDPQFVLMRLQPAIFLALMPVWWAAQVYFGLNVNRLLWERERRRFEAAAGDPPNPIPLWRFDKSTRFWTTLGLGLAALGVLGELVVLILRPESRASALTAWPSSVVPLALMFVINRVRSRRRQPAS